ncbi:chemotaxis protein CheB [Salinisphaera aquimarina]|uniref:protein-glutamate methylesterase n=1 Tax=Salinisphaera aquimarina TaxID=2094031 RepID=A0ABV7ES95_9GAMM
MSVRSTRALAIGGSSGSLSVLSMLLEHIVADSGLVVVVCVHTGSRDIDELCGLFARHCAIPVQEAGEREPLAPGRVYVACGGYHLLVERCREFALCAGSRVEYARPSIDVLFETMAEAYGQSLAAMLLSGANADGARGLRYIHELGGLTYVQRPDTASAEQMPRAALALFTPDHENSPQQLGLAIGEMSRVKP